MEADKTSILKDKFKYSIRQCAAFSLMGQAVKLTDQKTANIKICIQFWQHFNADLKKENLTQNRNWVKYAVMERINNDLIYTCAIPKKDYVPENFSVKHISAQSYLVVEHVGDMRNIYDTYTMIYHQLLPYLKIKPLSENFLHFEKYDNRFHWHRINSVIEIWVPIQ